MVLRRTKDIPRAQRRWVDVTLAGARFHNNDLTGARFNGVILDDVEIDGLLLGLTVNGVDVVPLVRAELDRRHPELVLIRSDDPDDLRAGWSVVKELWQQTTATAAALEPALLSEQVDHEWSFLQTLRHLVFVTDAWISRPVRDAERPYWPAGQPATAMPAWFVEACGLDLAAAPSSAEVMSARAERIEILDRVLATLTSDELQRRCTANRDPGYPSDTNKYTVAHCIHTTLSEEWAHHRFAARDLARL